jgi:hypothetical protein
MAKHAPPRALRSLRNQPRRWRRWNGCGREFPSPGGRN